MTEHTLFRAFDELSDASDAATKMRELVLELAVQGRLVPQDSRDETTQALLERVAPTAKTRGRSADEPKDTEAPFPLPETWAWVRLPRVLNKLTDGTHHSPPNGPSGAFMYVTAKNIKTDGVSLDGITYVSKEIHDEIYSRCDPSFGDVLYIKDGATTGIATINLVKEPFSMLSSVALLKPSQAIYNRYLLWAMRSPFFYAETRGAMKGAAITRVTLSVMAESLLPLPPLAEQARIVAKVEELMALCDALEARQTTRTEARHRLHAALLHHVTAAHSPSELAAHWSRLRAHFDPLHATPDCIPRLRQTILSLAIRGKLAFPDPNDELVADMVHKIEFEKRQLLEGGELKADKKVWVNSSQNPPHAIPDAWRWVRLQDVFEISRGGSPRPAGDPRFFGGSIPWITVGEITKDAGKYLTETATGLTEEGSERSRFINPGDLLLTNSGATLGVPKISKIRGCMNDGVAVLRLFHSFDLNDFAYLYLTDQTPAFRSVNQGMGQPNLNTPIIAGWFFPLPPLAEQRRIVAKVDQLMALCDELETRLKDADARRERLLTAAIQDMIAQTPC